MKPLFALLALSAALTLGGCAGPGNVSLAEVRDFADASARLGKKRWCCTCRPCRCWLATRATTWVLN